MVVLEDGFLLVGLDAVDEFEEDLAWEVVLAAEFDGEVARVVLGVDVDFVGEAFSDVDGLGMS